MRPYTQKIFACSLLIAALPIAAQTWVSDLVLIPVENDTQIGTSLYRLAKLNGAGQAVTVSQNDAGNVLGIVQQNAGKSGKAGIAQVGIALCDFDGATASGDYVQVSPTAAGLCHDAGPALPETGVILGRAMSTNAGPGVFEVFVFPGGSRGAGVVSSGAAQSRTEKSEALATAAGPIALASGTSPGGSQNAVQYRSGSSFAGLLNSSGDKRFVTQSSGQPPAFAGIALSDLPAISSADLSDSGTLIRDNEVTLAGTTPSTFGPVPAGSILEAYGDSITAGKGASTRANEYVNLIAAAKDWSVQNHAIGGDGLFDQLAEHLWGSTMTASSVGLLMIGANDDGYVYHQSAVWNPALQAAYLWLLTTQKGMGKGLSKKGTWFADSILSSGVYTTENKATASGTTFGNVVYVVARSTPANSPTFTIRIDDTIYGPFTTPVPWMTMRKHNFAPYSVRIGNLTNSYHTVTIENIGSGELHVDFIAGNKGQLTATGPYLYASTVYKVDTAWEFTAQFLNSQIRTTANQLAADGLGIVLADVEGDCANPNVVDTTKPGGSNCSLSDGVHPNDAGHRLIANAFLRMMPGGLAATNGKPAALQAANAIATGYATQNLSGSPAVAMDQNTLVWRLTGDASPRITAAEGKGSRFTLMVCQDGVGGRSITWPSFMRNAMTPSKAPNTCTVQDFVQTGLGPGDLVGLGSGSSFLP